MSQTNLDWTWPFSMTLKNENKMVIASMFCTLFCSANIIMKVFTWERSGTHDLHLLSCALPSLLSIEVCLLVKRSLKDSVSLTTWRLNSCPGTIFEADTLRRSFETVTRITWKGNMFTFPERSSLSNTMLEAFNKRANSATCITQYNTLHWNAPQYNTMKCNQGLLKMEMNICYRMKNRVIYWACETETTRYCVILSAH